jgi:hypothetical protein
VETKKPYKTIMAVPPQNGGYGDIEAPSRPAPKSEANWAGIGAAAVYEGIRIGGRDG